MVFKNIKMIKTIENRNGKVFDETINKYLDNGYEIIRLFELPESGSNPSRFVAQLALYDYEK